MNPANRYTEPATSRWSWLWVLLFGWIYFLMRGIWLHALILFLLQTPLVGMLKPPISRLEAWLLLVIFWFLPALPWAIFVGPITRKAYLRSGWVEVGAADDGTAPS